MSKNIAVYNPIACCGKGEKNAHRLDKILSGQAVTYYDITQIQNYEDFFRSVSSETSVIICGGDGTLNRFINATYNMNIPNDIYYFACGTGNDFLHDLGLESVGKPIKINQYIKDLPVVTVKGKQYRFLNNVGFGLEGYCCNVGDEMRAAHKKKINYTAIAIKGVLGGFHPVKANVTVDGASYDYEHVWIAPTLKGRFLGGGMMAAPSQNRSAESRTVSFMVYHCRQKLKALIVFPSIFKGEHIKHTEMVDIKAGHHIKVKFDRPSPLQIDGETILDVTEYEVNAE